MPSFLKRRTTSGLCIALCYVLITWFVFPAHAQELEPRRWAHLPINTNFATIAYAYKETDISFDPVLRIENAKSEIHTWAAAYTRTFDVFDKLVRIDLVQPWQDGRWKGLVNGEPRSINRRGFADSVARVAVNLVGAPPLSGKEYQAYRATTEVETIVGVGLAVQLPTGEYKNGKLINLGTNRFTFRPQVGVVHTRGKWSFEATGKVWIYTDNDALFNGSRLENDPYYTAQAHVIYTFRPGLWVATSAGYGIGGRSTINGDRKDDRKENLAGAISAGVPITNRLGVKFGYVGTRSQTSVGSDSDIFLIGLSTFW
jgi:hypothetical protein